MPKVGPFGSPLPMSIPAVAELLNLLEMMDTTTVLQSSPLLLLLATITMTQMVEWLMKGVTVLVGKGKIEAMAALSPFLELAQPPVKLLLGLVEGLLPES